MKLALTLIAALLLAPLADSALPPPLNGYTWAPIPSLTDEFNGASLDRTKWLPTTCDAGFHVYSFWWKDNRNMAFYHNGTPVQFTTTGGAFNEKMYLFFDTEVFSWEGWPTLASLQDPSLNTMYVDWIRSWKLVPQPPAVLVGKLLPNGSFQLGFGGQYDQTYSVWTSADLSNWSYLGPSFQNTNGVFEFTDSAAGNASARFYQMRSP